MFRYFRLFLVVVGLLPMVGAQASNAEFPGRKLFWDVPVMEMPELRGKLANVIVVDVRSKYEFDTLQIQGARNIPLADRSFVSEVAALRKVSTMPIVFYCNGRSCHKSYEAVVKARIAKIDGLYAFDAGVLDWVKAYPDKSLLLGKGPVNPAELINEADYQARLITPAEFVQRVGPNTMILDVRDPYQRGDLVSFSVPAARVGLDETGKIDQYIEQAKKEKKTLLVFDAVGRQVQWFQYYLERKGVKDYYFMNGGAAAYISGLGK